MIKPSNDAEYRPPSFVGCDDVRQRRLMSAPKGEVRWNRPHRKRGSETCDLWICSHESKRRMFFIFINITEVLL